VPVLLPIINHCLKAVDNPVTASKVGDFMDNDHQYNGTNVGYAYNVRFPIDESFIDNGIRPVALGRKNIRFAG
jgi:hypothetical protein